MRKKPSHVFPAVKSRLTKWLDPAEKKMNKPGCLPLLNSEPLFSCGYSVRISRTSLLSGPFQARHQKKKNCWQFNDFPSVFQEYIMESCNGQKAKRLSGKKELALTLPPHSQSLQHLTIRLVPSEKLVCRTCLVTRYEFFKQG